MTKILGLSVITAVSLIASNVSSNKITIYNNGLALFDEVKKLKTLNSGYNEIIYENVSPNMISDSVSVTLPKNIKLLEQNYKYDLVNHRNILINYIDKEVTYKEYISPEHFVEETGTLLSVENNKAVISSLKGIKSIPFSYITVKNLPKGMITKPSLVFKTYSSHRMPNKKIGLRYLSNGFNWKADYVATIDGKNLILNSWITLNNTSSVSLENYQLTLLAGEVNRAHKGRINAINSMPRMALRKKEVMEKVKDKSLGGYHVYKIPFNVDIPKKSKKQINFFNASTTNWEKINKITINSYMNGTQILKFNQVVDFYNKKENGLGMPFPSGVMRFYQKDDGSTFFIGENRIKDIPKNEKVSVLIGKDFDSVLEFKMDDMKNTNYKQFISYDYEIRNRSNENKKYEVTQKNPIYNAKNENMKIDSNCKESSLCTLEILNDQYIKYTVVLKPESTYKFKTFFMAKKY